jgi:membrane fusion protein (multidrug efflux system)
VQTVETESVKLQGPRFDLEAEQFMRAMLNFYGSAPRASRARRCVDLALPYRYLERSAAILGFLLLALLVMGCEKKEVPPEAAPPEVEVTDVNRRDVPVYQEWVAQLNGENNAEITPKVQGYLLKQDYGNGYYVKKGQLLYELDPRPFQAAEEKAKADVAIADANFAKAQNDVIRDTPLAAQNAIPKRQLDTDIANEASWKAQVQAQQAALQDAELNLDWTKVHSPIEGIAGQSISQVGDLVGTTTKMTTVSQVDPIRAYFNISESAFLGIAPRVSRSIRAGSRQRDETPVEFIQANDETYPAKGYVVMVNRQVTAGTGTIQLAAAFPNKDGTLRPGGFGRVRIRTGMTNNALLIPQPAVIEVQSQYEVVVIGADSKAAFRPIKVGDKVGPDWIITEGLKPGDRVVVQGFMKVREGMPVSVKPYVATVGSR